MVCPKCFNNAATCVISNYWQCPNKACGNYDPPRATVANVLPVAKDDYTLITGYKRFSSKANRDNLISGQARFKSIRTNNAGNGDISYPWALQIVGFMKLSPEPVRGAVDVYEVLGYKGILKAATLELQPSMYWCVPGPSFVLEWSQPKATSTMTYITYPTNPTNHTANIGGVTYTLSIPIVVP